MPFKSEAQRRYFEANKAKLEKQGVDVKEWEQSSKGMKLQLRSRRDLQIYVPGEGTNTCRGANPSSPNCGLVHARYLTPLLTVCQSIARSYIHLFGRVVLTHFTFLSTKSFLKPLEPSPDSDAQSVRIKTNSGCCERNGICLAVQDESL